MCKRLNLVVILDYQAKAKEDKFLAPSSIGQHPVFVA